MDDVTRKPHPLRWAFLAATAVFVIGAALPIWPAAPRGPFSLSYCHASWDSVGWSACYAKVMSIRVLITYYGYLPPMLVVFVFLTGLAGFRPSLRVALPISA